MQLTRRQFIKVTAAAVSSSASLTPAADSPDKVDGLPRRILGKTKERITILGLGCAWIAQDQSARNRRASEAHTRTVIEAALDGGIRYFDAAPNYYLAEERLGPLLAPVRHKVFLATKLDHADAKGAEQDLSNSLKLLKTDHVDLLLLHGLGLPAFDDLEMLQGKNGALTYLRKAKEKGLARFIGFSAHPSRIDEQRAFIENADLDVTQLFINYVSRAQHHIEEKVVEFARQHNKGVVAMKVLGGDGQMADDYDRAFRYALSVPGVHCALIGASSPQEVKRAVQAAKDFKPMTAAEMKETIALGRKLYESGAKKVALLNRHLPHDLGAVSRA